MDPAIGHEHRPSVDDLRVRSHGQSVPVLLEVVVLELEAGTRIRQVKEWIHRVAGRLDGALAVSQLGASGLVDSADRSAAVQDDLRTGS